MISRGLDLVGDKDGLPAGGDTGLDREPLLLQFVGKVIVYLLLPLLVAYAVYRLAAYFISRC